VRWRRGNSSVISHPVVCKLDIKRSLFSNLSLNAWDAARTYSDTCN
jgi:hypothetical protein